MLRAKVLVFYAVRTGYGWEGGKYISITGAAAAATTPLPTIYNMYLRSAFQSGFVNWINVFREPNMKLQAPYHKDTDTHS